MSRGNVGAVRAKEIFSIASAAQPIAEDRDEPTVSDEGPDEAEGDIDLTEFVHSFENDAELSLDDDAAPELDVGIVAIEEPGQEGADDDRGEMVLDIAELLAVADEAPAGDELGPPEFDPGADIEEPPDMLGETDEGPERTLDDLVSDELPSIDADEEGDFQIDEVLEAQLDARDEPLPPRAARAWELRTLVEGDSIEALVVERGLVVAAGDCIHLLGREARKLRPSARVTSAALCGGLLLYFTVAGQLVRQELSEDDGRVLDSWREPAGVRAGATIGLELGAGGLEPGVVLARTGDGRLLRSRDRGASFAAEDLHARVLSLDARSIPALALAETSAGRSLLAAVEGGSAWRAVTLDATAQRIAGGAQPLVAAAGDVIAIADPERGLALSSDDGRSFRRIQGGARVTALAVGSMHGAPQLWAAIYLETRDATLLARIEVEAGQAEIVAEIAGAAGDPDASDDGSVRALAWDAARQRLLVATGFGLFAVEPPAPESA
jgi:hypothetical protein